MNSTAPLTLDRAKRNLEAAVDAVKNSIRPDFKAINRESPLDYFYANAANKGAFIKRVAACRKAWDLRPESDNLIIHAVTVYQQVEEMAAAEKARLTAKRASVKAKADLKAELNLQEGVSLAGVDVGQYKVILAGLEPVRLHVYATRLEALKQEIQSCRNLLKARAFILRNHADLSGVEKVAYRATNEAHHELYSRINCWFERSVAYDQASVWVQRSNNPERVEDMAQQFALAYVQGYACKLSVKTGEVFANDHMLMNRKLRVVSAKVSTANLWSDSLATIAVEDDSLPTFALRFHTQMIWNRSCLGNVFNQYPTRRVL